MLVSQIRQLNLCMCANKCIHYRVCHEIGLKVIEVVIPQTGHFLDIHVDIYFKERFLLQTWFRSSPDVSPVLIRTELDSLEHSFTRVINTLAQECFDGRFLFADLWRLTQSLRFLHSWTSTDVKEEVSDDFMQF